LVRGINFVVPHAIWYNNERAAANPPELSFRSARYGPELPAYNNFIGRVSGLLQNGRHVADIGVVYPIHTLQAATQFDVGNPYYGVAPEEADYMELGHLLSTTLRRDFTYLHPEVIAARCAADGGTLRLQNDMGYENYKVLIMPGAKTISLAALEKIRDFFESGGQVIATTQLPYQSAEPGRDSEVRAIISAMFGVEIPSLLPPSTLAYTASSVFQNNPQYAPEKAFDGEAGNGSRWNAGDQSGGDQWLQVDFGQNVTVSRAVFKENPPYRVTAYRVQAWNGAGWTDCAAGSSIGASAAVDFAPVDTDKVRLYIDAIVSDSVSIQEFELYHNDSGNLARPLALLAERANEAGGRAVFLGRAYASTLADTLDRLLPVFDVEVSGVPDALPGGSFSYIHKVKDGHEIYYFANSGNTALSGTVDLRGRLSAPTLWNPHDGARTAAAYETLTVDGIPVTRVSLSLDAVSSVFVVARSAGEAAVSVHPDKAARAVTVTGSGFSPHQRIELLAAYQRPPSASDYDYAARIFADEAGDISVTLPAAVTEDLPWLGGHRYEASLDGIAASATIYATAVRAHSSARVSLRIKGKAPLNFSTDSAVYEFVSSNPDIVSVDQNGLVTGRKAGAALIILRALDGSGLSHIVTVSVG
ncbi:MAG: discoidin domain-containing protein, partial [Oscillospiraceae bacterium]|nr:discoidin domain-containing protein [Oscillospiraceae bacterium]